MVMHHAYRILRPSVLLQRNKLMKVADYCKKCCSNKAGDKRLLKLLEKIQGKNDKSHKVHEHQYAEIRSKLVSLEMEYTELQAMGSSTSDQELKEMAIADEERILDEIKVLQSRAYDLLIPDDVADSSDIIVEVTAGVGGQEAMLFTAELFNMYTIFADMKGWDVELTSNDSTEMGGMRKASASVSGKDVYKYLRYEGGIHRVQRVPKTESKGRVHTSTAAVVVLPQPSDFVVVINAKDLKIETKRASGAGGQHVNTTDSAVRIVHLPTGVAVECQTQRSQISNKETAMKILRAKLYQMKLDQQLESTNSARKLQVSSNSRSDKIRTYNFIQDRITDHRIGVSVRNVPELMRGGYPLTQLIETLMDEGRKELCEEMFMKEGIS